MKIDIWFDFTCPFCFLGKKRFDQAMKQFKHKSLLDIQYRSYILNPYFENEEKLTSHAYLAKLKDIKLEEAIQINHSIASKGFDEGLIYDFDRLIPASTIKAHQVMHLFSGHPNQSNFINDIYEAHFSSGLDISDDNVLIDFAVKQGLDADLVRNILTESCNLDLIKKDLDKGNAIKLKGVPFFLANDMYAISGAQTVYTFHELLEELYYETKPKKKSKTEVCDGDNCERKK